MLGLFFSVFALLLSLRLLFATEFGKVSLECFETVKKATCWSPEVHMVHSIKTTTLERFGIIALIPASIFAICFHIILMGI